MTVWIMEPHDPLLVRDGRPFGSNPGARARSLLFPFPSTIAGGMRTRAGLSAGGTFQYTKEDKDALENLKQLLIRGPFLVELNDSGELAPDKWLVPAPRDALLFPSQLTVKGESTALVEQLVPLQLPESAQTDADTQGLLFVGQEIGSEPHESKPLSKPPAYWYWATFKTWLLDPLALTGQAQVLSKLGLPELAHERRSHVSIDADKEVAEDGMLFETSGLEFTVPGSSEHRLKEARRLALAVAADDSNYSIRAGLARFGGERRIVTWRKSTEKLPPCPPKLEQAIIKGRSCRVILLTPACFEQGSRPVWFSAEAAKYGVTIDLKAMVIQRPQVVSGWDFASNKPKPSRRLAPAGTVLYLSLRGDDAAISKWIRDTWMQCISDGEQDRLDGFGVVVFGTWLGNPLDGEVI